MKMRRILSLFVALGLAGLEPLPVSACALLHSQTNECATQPKMTDCESMGMEQGGEKQKVTVSNAGNSCCAISNAPSPEAQTWAGSLSVVTGPAPVSGTIIAAQPFESKSSFDLGKDLSPPPLQALLCTFLI